MNGRAMARLPVTESLYPGAAGAQPVRVPQHALRAWTEIAQALRCGGRLALFLDFDGTLVGIRRRPEGVRCSERMRSALTRLVKRPNLWIGIVSGRRARTLAKLIGVAGIHYCGAYGAESEGSALKISWAARRALSRVRSALRRQLRRLAGVWMEDKGLSFVVHYRGAGRLAVAEAEDLLRGAMAPARQLLRVMAGHKSWEIVPREIPGKGAAVAAVMQSLPAGSMGIYIGDDAADEAAFAALPGGITIRVGRNGKSQARYFLRSPAEVLKWLVRFEGALP